MSLQHLFARMSGSKRDTASTDELVQGFGWKPVKKNIYFCFF